MILRKRVEFRQHTGCDGERALVDLGTHSRTDANLIGHGHSHAGAHAPTAGVPVHRMSMDNSDGWCK